MKLSPARKARGAFLFGRIALLFKHYEAIAAIYKNTEDRAERRNIPERQASRKGGICL